MYDSCRSLGNSLVILGDDLHSPVASCISTDFLSCADDFASGGCVRRRAVKQSMHEHKVVTAILDALKHFSSFDIFNGMTSLGILYHKYLHILYSHFRQIVCRNRFIGHSLVP